MKQDKDMKEKRQGKEHRGKIKTSTKTGRNVKKDSQCSEQDKQKCTR